MKTFAQTLVGQKLYQKTVVPSKIQSDYFQQNFK